jgi:hypothetical protein
MYLNCWRPEPDARLCLADTCKPYARGPTSYAQREVRAVLLYDRAHVITEMASGFDLKIAVEFAWYD